MVRQHPKDVQLWLRFAAFQMEFLPLQRRPNLLPVLEKQSAILSRALSVCGDDVVLIDPAVAVATELTRRLGNDRLMDEQHIGTTRFFTTGDVLHVQQVVAHLWGDGALVEAMTQ